MALYYYDKEQETVSDGKRGLGKPYRSYPFEAGISPDRLLDAKVEQACIEDGVDYRALEPIQRLFLTHYRCPICKLVPLYNLDLAHPKRVRCKRCGQLICFRGTGKWGKMRKKVAYQFMSSMN